MKTKKNNWKIKHEEFIAAIRYAKLAGKIEREGGDLSRLAPPPPSSNPDYVCFNFNFTFFQHLS